MDIKVENDSTIGERLKQLRISRGIRSPELLALRASSGVAEEEAITAGYIRKLESGEIKSPGFDALTKLARGFGLTPGDLADILAGKRKIPPPVPPTLPELINMLQDLNDKFSTIDIPIVGNVPTEQKLNLDKPEKYVTIRKEYIGDFPVEDIKAVIQVGNSLASEGIYDSWDVIFNVSQRKIKDGEIYLVRVGKEQFLCSITHISDHLLNLRYDNKNHQVLDSDVEIVGLVGYWGKYQGKGWEDARPSS